MPVNQEPIVIVVATPSLSLDALVLFPQPPIQAELFGSSPVLSFTSLIEVQVAVAEQELLVEESELPESFLLASNNADATSILDDVSQESKPCSCS